MATVSELTAALAGFDPDADVAVALESDGQLLEVSGIVVTNVYAVLVGGYFPPGTVVITGGRA